MPDAPAEPLHAESIAAARHVRVTAVVIAIGCAVILFVAMYLTPDPRGFGTHEQLGLPPCISTKFLHVPCPVCGMTTAFSLMAHVRPIDAFRTQPAGAILFAVCMIALAGSVSTFVSGYVPSLMVRVSASRVSAWTFAVLLTAGWLYKVYVFYR